MAKADDEQRAQAASLQQDQQQDQIDIEQAEIDVAGGAAAQESALYPWRSQASALSKDNGAEAPQAALESAHGRTGSVIMVEDQDPPSRQVCRSVLAAEVPDEAYDFNQ